MRSRGRRDPGMEEVVSRHNISARARAFILSLRVRGSMRVRSALRATARRYARARGSRERKRDGVDLWAYWAKRARSQRETGQARQSRGRERAGAAAGIEGQVLLWILRRSLRWARKMVKRRLRESACHWRRNCWPQVGLQRGGSTAVAWGGKRHATTHVHSGVSVRVGVYSDLVCGSSSNMAGLSCSSSTNQAVSRRVSLLERSLRRTRFSLVSVGVLASSLKGLREYW